MPQPYKQCTDVFLQDGSAGAKVCTTDVLSYLKEHLVQQLLLIQKGSAALHQLLITNYS